MIPIRFPTELLAREGGALQKGKPTWRTAPPAPARRSAPLTPGEVGSRSPSPGQRSAPAEQRRRLALFEDAARGVEQAEAADGVKAKLPLEDLARLALGRAANRRPVGIAQAGLLDLELGGHGCASMSSLAVCVSSLYRIYALFLTKQAGCAVGAATVRERGAAPRSLAVAVPTA